MGEIWPSRICGGIFRFPAWPLLVPLSDALHFIGVHRPIAASIGACCLLPLTAAGCWLLAAGRRGRAGMGSDGRYDRGSVPLDEDPNVTRPLQLSVALHWRCPESDHGDWPMPHVETIRQVGVRRYGWG